MSALRKMYEPLKKGEELVNVLHP